MATYAGCYSEDLQDRYGNGFRNAKVAVQSVAEEAIVLYADREKATYVPPQGLASNEVYADQKGNLRFFADPGHYQIVVTPSGGSALPAYPIDVQKDPLEPSGFLGLLTKAALLLTSAAEGIVAPVSDNIRGLWMRGRVGWYSLKGDVLRVKEFGGIGDGTQHPLSEFFDTLAEAQAVYSNAVALTDLIDGVAWQAAIDAAQLGSTKNPLVDLGSGDYHINTPINWKSARIYGNGANNSCRVFWDGTAGATVITQNTQVSFNELRGINFRDGTAEPGTWLEFGANAEVDAFCRLWDLHFIRSSGDAIKMVGWYNCHWRHLRFDHLGGYAIRATPHEAQNLSSFLLDGFTYDHNRLSGQASGAFMVDNSAGTTNLGTFAVKNARIEINEPWVGHQAILELKNEKARSIGLQFENISYVDGAGMASDVLVYHDSVSTALFPSLQILNCRMSLSAIVGGTLSTNYPAIPVQPLYGVVSVSSNGQDAIFAAAKLLTTSFGGETPLTLRRGAETQDRFQLGPRGELNWSSGSAATDLALSRSAASVLAMGSDDCFITGKNVTGSRPTASAVGQGAQFFDTTLNKPIWSTGSVWVDATGTTV